MLVAGCTPVDPGEPAASTSTHTRTREAFSTRYGWRLSPHDIPVPRTDPVAASKRPQWTARADDTTPSSLLISTRENESMPSISYLVDRRSGRVRWQRSDVTNCFFENDDRVWCLPVSDRTGSIPGSDRVVIDGSTRVVKRLKGGRATDAWSALARNRGDADSAGSPNIVTITKHMKARTGIPLSRIEVRARFDNRLLVREEPEHDSNNIDPIAQTYRDGFATSLDDLETDEKSTRLYDNDGRFLSTVAGLLPLKDKLCDLPALTDGDSIALIDPHTGIVRYRGAPTQFYPACGPDYLVDGSVFVDADGRARDLGIDDYDADHTKVTASRTRIAIVDRDSLTLLNRHDLSRITHRRFAPGTLVAIADHRSVAIVDERGFEYIAL